MKRLILLVIGMVGLSTILSSAPLFAVEVFDQCSDIDINSSVCESGQGGEEEAELTDMTQTIVSTLLVALGMVAVIMIVIGGIRYATSRGEAAEVKRAKEIILYSIIGLIVAILAFSIVNFVLDAF